jgi:PAS domain S-box-containing protein
MRAQLQARTESKESPIHESDQASRLQTKVLEIEDLEAQVAELRRAKAVLEAGRNRYLDLYVNAPIPYVIFDLAGTLKQVNHAAVATFGASARKLVGTAFAKLLSPSARQSFETHLGELAQATACVSIELALCPRDAEARIIQMVSMPMADGPNDVMAILFDVTERKRNEGILQLFNRASVFFASVATPAAVVDELPSLVVPLIADLCVAEFYEPCGKVHLALDAAEPYSARLRAFGRRFMKLPSIASAVSKSVATGAPQLVASLTATAPSDIPGAEEAGVLSDLDLKSLLALPLMGRGQVFGVLVLGAASDRRGFGPFDVPIAAELARRASLAIDNGRMFIELHEEQAAKNRFLAMLAHELRTPLTPVLVAITALLDQGHNLRQTELRRLLKMVRDNVGLEARLIDDLVDVVRAARGQFELSLESIDVREVIWSVVGGFQPDLVKKKIVLLVDLEAHRHEVRADPARLKQILSTFLRNAIKFTPERGTIRVGSHASRDRLYVHVTDNGIGIDPRHITRIFDPFAQADASIGPRFGGMGLNLAICKTLAVAHRGKISVTSEGVGKGATFTFEMPLESPGPGVDPVIGAVRRVPRAES